MGFRTAYLAGAVLAVVAVTGTGQDVHYLDDVTVPLPTMSSQQVEDDADVVPSGGAVIGTKPHGLHHVQPAGHQHRRPRPHPARRCPG